ncbi:MAG: DUF874 domain-containing protein [Rhodobacteraceae bacterium]|nr:DUF874 domain-containing protein [Paracoccaceae bacterium]
MGPIYTPADFIDMVRRRFWVILAVLVIGSAVSVGYALMQTHLYRSAEVIQIARPKIADDLAPSTVAGSSARRLQLIQQQIMTRATLLEIVDSYGLFQDQPDLTLTEKVIQLREAVSIDGVAAAREGFTDDGTISVLTITATMPTPELAQAIASEFSQRTLRLSDQTRIEQAEATLEFFARQEQQMEEEIVALESRIARFQAENNLISPSALDSLMLELAGIRDSLLEIERQKITLQRQIEGVDLTARQETIDRRIADLRAQLEGLEEQRALLEQRANRLEAEMETSPELARIQAEYDRQLELLQTRLAEIVARRSDAEVGFRLESQQQAERLLVIEPAALPDYPVTTSRKRMAAIGAAISLFLGLVVAFLLELRHPVIRTAAQMKREIGLAPVVSIPFLDTGRKRRRWFGGPRDSEGKQA